jgi:hypothetical protein
LSGALIAAGAAAPHALGQGNLAQENEELKKRVEALENLMKKEGIMPSAGKPTPVQALSEITISGFVQASYFYDTSKPTRDRASDGYLWNTTYNSFSINKVKLTLASKPVERSGDQWNAGFRTSMIWGEDASVVNTGGETQGLEDLREAYVEMNIPIGTGLNVKAGQLISLLNYESGDGGAANNNFSQGFQWFYTGNGPSTGVQLGYTFTDWLDAKVRIQNGMYAGAIDANDGKAIMGSIGIKPCEQAWINLIAFYSEEAATMDVGGASILAGGSITKQLGFGFEFDYFEFNNEFAPNATLWSVGGWLSYDFNDKVTLAFRGEYLSDEDGGGIRGIALPGRPGSAIVGPGADGDLSSLTLTLTLKPAPNVRIQPEVRYDNVSYEGGFDGRDNRLIVGAGISYLF